MIKIYPIISLFVGLIVHAEIATVGEPNITWQKNQVHVCWQSGAAVNPEFVKNDFDLEKRIIVQNIVEQEYSIEKTGITFVGWEDCSELKQGEYDLQIFQDIEDAPSNSMVEWYRAQGSEGQSVIGQGSVTQMRSVTNRSTGEMIKQHGYFTRDQRDSTMYLLYRPQLSILQLQLTALHEFGHAAGLRHEHILQAAKKDPNCKNVPRFKSNHEEILDTATLLESYDPNSIMNYCWLVTLTKNGNIVKKLPNVSDESMYKVLPNSMFELKIGLSSKDISALNQLYPKTLKTPTQ